MDLSKILGGPSYPITSSPPHYTNTLSSPSASLLSLGNLNNFNFSNMHLPQPEILLSNHLLSPSAVSPTFKGPEDNSHAITQRPTSPSAHKRNTSKNSNTNGEGDKETSSRSKKSSSPHATTTQSTKNPSHKRKSATKRSSQVSHSTSNSSSSTPSTTSVTTSSALGSKEKKIAKKYGLKATLRQLETEAYSAVISAFRAQGELTWQKDRILQELRSALKISDEKHRLELLRIESDETLVEIAKYKIAQIPVSDGSVVHQSDSDAESSASESEADHNAKRRKVSIESTNKSSPENAYPPLMIHPLPSSDGAPAIIKSCIKKLPSKISRAIVMSPAAPSSTSSKGGGKGRRSTKDIGSPPPSEEAMAVNKARKQPPKRSGAAKMLNSNHTPSVENNSSSKAEKEDDSAADETELPPGKPKMKGKRAWKTKMATAEAIPEEKKVAKGKENEKSNGEDDELVEIMEDDDKEPENRAAPMTVET